MDVFCKTSIAFSLVPVLKVLIATITPLVGRVFPVAHQTFAITMTRVSAVFFEEVVPEQKCQQRQSKIDLGLSSVKIYLKLEV